MALPIDDSDNLRLGGAHITGTSATSAGAGCIWCEITATTATVFTNIQGVTGSSGMPLPAGTTIRTGADTITLTSGSVYARRARATV